MGLKYNASGRTYDLGGPQYTNVGGAKRLNYIASGKTHQLGLATDKTCSQYSPLVMKVNGTNYYIGRSQSGSYITSDSILSTHLNTFTSGGYSTQYYTYGSEKTYKYIKAENAIGSFKYITSLVTYQETTLESYTTTDYKPAISYIGTVKATYIDENDWYHSGVITYTQTIRYEFISQQTLTSTKNVYYTTSITNAVNTTASTTKSASSSSHNFV